VVLTGKEVTGNIIATGQDFFVNDVFLIRFRQLKTLANLRPCQLSPWTTCNGIGLFAYLYLLQASALVHCVGLCTIGLHRGPTLTLTPQKEGKHCCK